MVNDRIGSYFAGPPEPPDADTDDVDRRIADGPLYPAHQVSQLLDDGEEESITVVTRKCRRDAQTYSLDGSDHVDLVRLAVSQGRFKGSEWCIANPGGPWFACDAYEITRQEYCENAGRTMDFEYYVKFAIGKTGAIVVLASCHP